MKIKKPVEIKNFAKLFYSCRKLSSPVLLSITFIISFIFKIEINCFTVQNEF